MLDFDAELGVTQRVLDAAAIRARVILHNIANQNTPGFKRFVVSFEDRLREAQRDGRPASEVEPVVERDRSGPPGRNNVDAVEETALLEKVQLVNDIFTRRAGGYFQRLNAAIRGRG